MAVDSDQGRRSSAAASAIQRRPVAMESGSLTAIIIINIIIFANLDLLAHLRRAGEPGRAVNMEPEPGSVWSASSGRRPQTGTKPMTHRRVTHRHTHKHVSKHVRREKGRNMLSTTMAFGDVFPYVWERWVDSPQPPPHLPLPPIVHL